MVSSSGHDEYTSLKENIRNPISHLSLAKDRRKFHFKGGFVSYSVVAGTAVALGEPVCAEEKMGEAVRAFRLFCRQRRMRTMFFCTEKATITKFDAAEFDKYRIGDDALVALPLFGCKKITRASRRAEKDGLEVKELNNTPENLKR
ncbi:MAG: phosphatidylglycerol lysyltransferase domain-containing protein, partial [Candidatus Micrarchaeia archaeon]